jgi:hypothetical protein
VREDVGRQVSADSVSMASEACALPAGAGDGGGRQVLTIGKHRCSGLSPKRPGPQEAQGRITMPIMRPCAPACWLLCPRRSTFLASRELLKGCVVCAGKLKRFHEMLSLHAGAAAVEDLDAARQPPTLKHHVHAPGDERWRTLINGRVLDDTRKVSALLLDRILARYDS